MSWFETEKDRANEQAVADAMTARWQVEPVKLPPQFRVDYCLFRGWEIKAWAEVKCRLTTREAYPTYTVSLAKVEAGQRLAKAHAVPFLLVVRWADATGWCEPALGDIRATGRNDRGTEDAVEQMVHIPLSAFRRL
jgi:hypothetical protein